MTTDRIALQQLLEKGSDTDLLREMVGFVADRLMALEVESLCGAAPGERTPARNQPAQRLSRPGLGYPRRHARAQDPEAPPRLLLPGLPRAQADR